MDFREEFTCQAFNRGIICLYEDLKECRQDIEQKIRKEGAFMENPNNPKQYWCLIKLREMGLTKIVLEETPIKIRVVTIINPVTDPRCHDCYNDHIKKFKSKES